MTDTTIFFLAGLFLGVASGTLIAAVVMAIGLRR